MSIFQWFAGALANWSRPLQSVYPHDKNQAYGPRWSRHRRRRIGNYHRKQPRRRRW